MTSPAAVRRLCAIGALLLLAPGCATIAALGMSDTEPHRVRGTVAAFDGSTLTVDTREGGTAEIEFGLGWQTIGVVEAALSDAEPGDFVGIASVPLSDGRDSALEMVIFPADMAGYGEGSYAWDLEPDSTMTNGTVANAVKSVDGNALTLVYEGGERTITVPEDVPVVTFVDATEAQLVEGAAVFVPAQIDKSGNIYAPAVVVGTEGVVPPM